MLTPKKLMTDLVEINTIRDKENKEIMDYLEWYLLQYDFMVERRMNPENGKELMVAQFGDNPTLGFMGHTDTVDVTEGWTYEPLKVTEEDGKLYGLGTCDMKGGIACALWAVANAPLKQIKEAGKGIKLYWTYDEEILFGGINDLVRSGEVFPPHVLVAEPTDLMPEIGSKGILEFIFTFNGVATHSSRPIAGKSSNKNAVEFLHKMIAFEKELEEEEYTLFSVPRTTMNIGIMEGGTAMNKVPAKTTIHLDFRICDSKGQYQRIREFVDEAIAEFDAEYTVINDVPSFINDGDRIAWYEEISGKKAETGNGITEASFFEGDRIIMGPGPMVLHQANEHVTEESLNKCAKIFLEAIKRECL